MNWNGWHGYTAVSSFWNDFVDESPHHAVAVLNHKELQQTSGGVEPFLTPVRI